MISDGTRFLAYGWEATFTSPDGWTWMHHPTTNSPGKFVCFGPLGYVKVGDSGIIETSSDGIHWSEPNIRRWLTHRQMAFGNGKLVCVDNSRQLVAFPLENGVLKEPVSSAELLLGNHIVFGKFFPAWLVQRL